MVFSRELDDAAFKLQRSGRMGTYPPNKGSEATSLGAASALTKGVDHIARLLPRKRRLSTGTACRCT